MEQLGDYVEQVLNQADDVPQFLRDSPPDQAFIVKDLIGD